MSIRAYLLRVAVSIDQLGNSILGGDPDETISSRVGRAAAEGKRLALILEHIIDWIFVRLGQPPWHCRRSIERKRFGGLSGLSFFGRLTMALTTTSMRITSDDWTLVASNVTDVVIEGPAFGYMIAGNATKPAASSNGISVSDPDGQFTLGGIATTDNVYAKLKGPAGQASNITVMSK